MLRGSTKGKDWGRWNGLGLLQCHPGLRGGVGDRLKKENENTGGEYSDLLERECVGAEKHNVA